MQCNLLIFRKIEMVEADLVTKKTDGRTQKQMQRKTCDVLWVALVRVNFTAANAQFYTWRLNALNSPDSHRTFQKLFESERSRTFDEQLAQLIGHEWGGEGGRTGPWYEFSYEVANFYLFFASFLFIYYYYFLLYKQWFNIFLSQSFFIYLLLNYYYINKFCFN